MRSYGYVTTVFAGHVIAHNRPLKKWHAKMQWCTVSAYLVYDHLWFHLPFKQLCEFFIKHLGNFFERCQQFFFHFCLDSRETGKGVYRVQMIWNGREWLLIRTVHPKMQIWHQWCQAPIGFRIYCDRLLRWQSWIYLTADKKLFDGFRWFIVYV